MEDQPFQAIWVQAKQTVFAPNMFVSDCKLSKGEIIMGYYSEVAITLYKDDFETLVKRAAEECEHSLDLIRNATLYKDEDNETVSMTWNSVKWYEGLSKKNTMTKTGFLARLQACVVISVWMPLEQRLILSHW